MTETKAPYYTKTDIIKSHLKEEFSINIIDKLYRDINEDFCDAVSAEFDRQIDLLSSEELSAMYQGRQVVAPESEERWSDVVASLAISHAKQKFI